MGEFKFTIDQKNKIVRCNWIGTFEADEFEETFRKAVKEIKKYPKGVAMGLGIHTEFNMKFLTPEMAKSVDEFLVFLISYTKKTASVVPSFMFQKSLESAANTKAPNYAIFVSEQEAIKWLMED